MKQARVSSILVAVLLLAAGVIAEAQQPGKVARIGYLDDSTASASAELLNEFRKQMIKLDWIEGKNLTIEYRHAEGKIDRLDGFAVELVGLKVDVIVAQSTSPALAAKRATTSIPIVMVGVADPVGQGLIASLARPGGNITGLATFSEELSGKRLEILKEVLPKATRVGVITGPRGSRGNELQLKAMNESAAALGLKLVELGSAVDPEKLVSAFSVAVRERVNMITITAGLSTFGSRKSIIALAANHNLPAIYPQKEFVEDGGLMSYRGGLGSKWLRRARPIASDFGVPQFTLIRYSEGQSLLICLSNGQSNSSSMSILKQQNKSALTIPPNVLVRADKVIK